MKKIVLFLYLTTIVSDTFDRLYGEFRSALEDACSL